MVETKNIVIVQRASHTELFDVTIPLDPTLPISATNPWITPDWTGITAKLQVRKSFDSAKVELEVQSGSGIVLGAAGLLTLHLTPAQTAAFSFAGDRKVYVYDLLFITGNEVICATAGNFTVKKAVTRL